MKLASIALLFLFLGAQDLPAGAWGPESFQNDSAVDWVENFFKSDGIAAVDRMLHRVVASNGYLDVDVASAAVAAAETVAIARGQPGRQIPADVEAQAKRLPPKRVEALVPHARRALDRVLADSELKDLWADSPEYAAWKAAVEGLKTRLR